MDLRKSLVEATDRERGFETKENVESWRVLRRFSACQVNKMQENSQMTREREIVLEALEQPSMEARTAFVERATAGDPKLKEGVQALLSNTEADTFLENGAGELLRESMETTGKLTPVRRPC